jgi:PadR family transcriptional regulator, regulatory protein PadR
MEQPMPEREWKKGSAELLILSLIEHEARHGYELGKLIESRSKGVLRFHVASLYPLLYRLEKRGWIDGRWVEKAGQRRRRYYRLTAEGKKVLAAQRHQPRRGGAAWMNGGKSSGADWPRFPWLRRRKPGSWRSWPSIWRTGFTT